MLPGRQNLIAIGHELNTDLVWLPILHFVHDNVAAAAITNYEAVKVKHHIHRPTNITQQQLG
jgi:hypothetical protein